MEDNRVLELAIGEVVLIKNRTMQGKEIIEGKAIVKEIIDFSLEDSMYHCMVEFLNEPGQQYERFVWL